MRNKLLLMLACPKCKRSLINNKNFLICKKCKLAFPIIEDKIPNLILEDAWKLNKTKEYQFKHNIKL